MRLLSRALFLATLVGVNASCLRAQDPPATAKPEEKAKPKPLKVGDAAPAITVQKWLNGQPVASFEAGKVYVLDFWAVWCGPCIQAMPHLAELQKAHAAEGLVVFPVTTLGSNNSLEQVTSFVTKKGPKLGVPFAVCENDVMDGAWFQASGQQGIPCSFVVDKQGKVAFIGHPMELDEVLPMVLAGTWKGEESVKALKAIDAELEAIQMKSEKEPGVALTELEAFGKKYPERAKGQMFVTTKLVILMQAKKLDEAKALSESILAESAKTKTDKLLGLVVAVWSAAELNPEKKHLDLIGRAAEVMAAIDPADALSLFKAARAYKAAGNDARATELAAKAIELADEELKPQLKAAVERMNEKK